MYILKIFLSEIDIDIEKTNIKIPGRQYKFRQSYGSPSPTLGGKYKNLVHRHLRTLPPPLLLEQFWSNLGQSWPNLPHLGAVWGCLGAVFAPL